MSATEHQILRRGRNLTETETEHLAQLQRNLGLKPNDALWALFIALDYYVKLYADFPDKIADAATHVMNQAKEAADSAYQAASERAHASLIRTVAKSVQETADRAASRGRWGWIAGCVAVAAAMFVIVGGFSYWVGSKAGSARGESLGYAAARSEEAAAAWANTPEGQLAYGLATAGSIQLLATCGGRGWTRKRDMCFPTSEKGSVHGWQIPGQERSARQVPAKNRR